MKTIVLLSDGTGNSSAKVFRTNVWRTYQALDLSQGDQIAYYDNGVGTSSFKPLALLGGAFGWGLKRNVRDLYAFLCRNYQDGDRVMAFGFSRGAFTIRVLVDMISDVGVIRGQDGSKLANLTAWVYRKYRGKHNTTGGLVKPLRWLRDGVMSVVDRLRGAPTLASPGVVTAQITIAFVGLWDTVSAYGLPIQEMTRGWDQWVWPLSMDDCRLSAIVARACHALSLDDERQTFHPLLWDERGQPASQTIDTERITQVWFAGVHSNVGGGYPDDSLSYVPLEWIADQAEKQGLRFMPAARAEWARAANPRGPIYDSRKGLGGYYRYSPRRIAPIAADARIVYGTPKIHETVLERIASGVDEYAPIVIPAHYSVVRSDGTIVAPDRNVYEPATQAHQRAHTQERCWNLVWLKRWVYFATVAVSVLLAISPFAWTRGGGLLDGELAAASIAIGWLSAFLPDLAKTWIEHYQRFPVRLLVGGSALAVLMFTGAAIGQSVTDRMKSLWRAALANPPGPIPARPVISDILFRIRTHPAYRMTIRLFNRVIFPTAFGVSVLLAIVLLVVAAANRVVFTLAGGSICTPGSVAAERLATGGWRASVPNNDLCHGTGIPVEAGRQYTIEIALPRSGWYDATIAVPDAGGFASPTQLVPFIPFRRAVGLRWFTPMVRIGGSVWEQHALGPAPTTVIARRSGEVFFFVNDALAPWPYWRAFYGNNRGEPGTLTVTPVE